MAKAAFRYLAGKDQTADRVQVLADSWAWLIGDAKGARVRAILESPTIVVFDWLPTAEEARSWPGGRAFGPVGELMWRTEDGLTHLVLVTDRDDLPPPFEIEPEPNRVDLVPAGGSPLLDEVWLWGTRQADGAWHETRVPGPLSYPLEGAIIGQSAALTVKRYRIADQPDRGTDDFVRCMDVAARSIR